MKITHYADFDFQQESNEDRAFLLKEIFTGIHLAIVQECGNSIQSQEKLAVNFPIEQGGIIRLMASDKSALERSLRHFCLYRFNDFLSEIIEIKDELLEIGFVKRDRQNEPISPSKRRRMEKRHQEKSKNLLLEKVEGKRPRATNNFKIQVKSLSNGNEFSIYLKQVRLLENAAFSSYGLVVETK